MGELGLGASTREQQLALLSLQLSPAGILVINGLENVSQTPRGNPVAMAYGGTEKHIALSFSLKWRKTPPCLVSDLANGSKSRKL